MTYIFSLLARPYKLGPHNNNPLIPFSVIWCHENMYVSKCFMGLLLKILLTQSQLCVTWNNLLHCCHENLWTVILSLHRYIRFHFHCNLSEIKLPDEVSSVCVPPEPYRGPVTWSAPLAGYTCQDVARVKGCRHVWSVLCPPGRQGHKTDLTVWHTRGKESTS